MSDTAFDRLALLEHREWVRALAWRVLRDENDVDDVEQDTWAVALRTRPDEPRALRGWLGKVASNLALQRLRARGRRTRREAAVARPEAGQRSPAEVLAEADAHGRVVQAVLALEEPYRTTVLLRYFEGLAIAEVAARMAVPLETTRTRLRRAHDLLRRELGDDERSPLVLLALPFVGARGTTAGAGPATVARTHSIVRVVVAAAAAVALVAVAVRLLGSSDGADELAAAPADADAAPVVAGAPPAAGKDAAKHVRPRHPSLPGAAAADVEDQRAAADQPRGPWRAFDLADGAPLAKFSLRIRKSEGEVVATTDEHGNVPVDPAEVLGIEAAAEGWKLALPENVAPRDEPSLWFWRKRPVTGSLRSTDSARLIGPGEPTLSTCVSPTTEVPDEPGRGRRWLSARGFETWSAPATGLRLDAQGRLSGELAAVRGTLIAAELKGHAANGCRIEWKDDGPGEAEIVLRPSVRIVGRLLEPDGNSAAGVTVACDTSIAVTTPDDAWRIQVQRPRGGWSFGGRSNGCVGNLIDQATTDSRGVFVFDVAPEGSTTILVRAPDCEVASTNLGELHASPAPFEMRLVRAPRGAVLLKDGAPLASSNLGVQLADGVGNGFQLPTDAEGRANLAWLERGKWYRVVVTGLNRCLKWDGETSVDLDKLPKEPESGEEKKR